MRAMLAQGTAVSATRREGDQGLSTRETLIAVNVRPNRDDAGCENKTTGTQSDGVGGTERQRAMRLRRRRTAVL